MFGVRGVAAAVRLPDNTIWRGAAGTSTLTPFVPLRPNMLFGVASVTKTFTAALTMRLVDRGFITLNDPIGRHLPAIARIPTINQAITIRQLLNHTSGLAEYTTSRNFVAQPSHQFTDIEILNLIGPPVSTPGTTYRYNNTGYFLLGLILQVKYFLPLAPTLTQNVWRAFGMDSTFMGYAQFIPPTIEQANAWTNNTPPMVNMTLSPRTALFSGFNSAGGSLSTVGDLARWGRVLVRGPMLSAASRQAMQTVTPLSVAAGTPYGLGCTPFPLGTNRTGWGHMGSIPGCLAVFCYEPVCDVSIAILFNDDSWGAIRPLIQQRIYTLLNRALCSNLTGVAEAVERATPPTFAPNPATGTTHLDFECPAGTRTLQLALLDATGRAVRTTALDPALPSHEVPLAGLAPGVYQARLQLTATTTAAAATAITRLVIVP